MHDLITTATATTNDMVTFGLTESKRELIPLAFASFLDSAAIATGRGTFYNSREEQTAAVEAAHRDLMEVDCDVYAAALLMPGVTDYSRQIGVRRLLQTNTVGGLLSAQTRSIVVQRLVQELPTQRMLKLFGTLRRERINNARTRRLILDTLLNADSLEFWAVKYRTKLRVAFTHAWGRRVASILRCVLAKPAGDRTESESQIVRKNLTRLIARTDRVIQSQTTVGVAATHERVEQCVRFILGDENNVTLERLAAYRDAKSDFARGSVLPTETMEGLRSRFHRERSSADVLALTKSQLTSGQKIAVQRKASAAGVDVKFDPARYDAARLYVYAFEMGMTDAIRHALIDKAKRAAAQLPVRFDRVGVLIDSSLSMVGHDTQARRPIATALALRDMLVATAEESSVLTSDGTTMGVCELVQPSGDTSLAGGLVRLLKEEPDAVFVLTDGYENAPAGRFADVVAAVRRMGVKTPIHQFTPVFAAESRGVRKLSDTLVAMPVNNPESIGLGLLKALMEADVDRGVAALFGMTKLRQLSLTAARNQRDLRPVLEVNDGISKA